MTQPGHPAPSGGVARVTDFTILFHFMEILEDIGSKNDLMLQGVFKNIFKKLYVFIHRIDQYLNLEIISFQTKTKWLKWH